MLPLYVIPLAIIAGIPLRGIPALAKEAHAPGMADPGNPW